MKFPHSPNLPNPKITGKLSVWGWVLVFFFFFVKYSSVIPRTNEFGLNWR